MEDDCRFDTTLSKRLCIAPQDAWAEVAVSNSASRAALAAVASAPVPSARDNPATVAASSYVPTIDKSLVATRDEVKAQIESGKGRLVDSRPADFFNGDTRHQAARLPGTLKGAVNLEHSRWFVPGTSTLASPDEIRRVAATLPAGSEQADTVSFCNTGHWAATNWFALSEVAGQKNVKLYAGSMVEWTQSPLAALMDNVPSRAKQLAIDARLWAERTVK